MNKLSIVLMGGLGNRLFQISSLYGLAKKYNRTMVLHFIQNNPHSSIDYFQNILRNFKLPIFSNINYRICEPGEMCLKNFIKELPNCNIRLYGYFQTESYFFNYRNELLNLFEIEPERLKKIMEKYPDIKSKYFIHIRRGDYVNHFLHYLNLEEYYKRSIEFIKSIDSEAKFYILSNDNDYCRNLNWNDCQLIEDYEEVDGLYIMSLCEKGGICPNSSYSWWGGWLNRNEGKIIIFPNKWFNNDWDCDIGFKNSYICDIKNNSYNFLKV